MEQNKVHLDKLFLVCSVAVFFFGLAIFAWVKEEDAFSDSERRVLADFPQLTEETLLSGKFMTEFEEYSLDQFPLRDTFRSIKAIAQFGLFRQKDNNDIYMADGYVSKLEYPMNEYMLKNAGDKFRYLYDTYMEDSDVQLYFAIAPDKNYYLAESNGYLSMDYEAFYASMKEKTEYMTYIELADLLSVEDYYRTDTHWKQECLDKPGGVADRLAESMGNTRKWEYQEMISEEPFYGVYHGQSALPLTPDSLTYLTNDLLEACTVTSLDTGSPVVKEMYDLQELSGKDPYEMFLSGSDALLVVDNPNATTNKELVVFRDSFASSLIPLLVESYRKVTLVDIRYINSGILGNFIEFTDQDVLFLYSTLVLNSSISFK